MSTDIYSEKQIAKELTLALVAKMSAPVTAGGSGYDYKKFAEQIGEYFKIIHAAVKESKV
jgi:hypothetical protein